MYEAYWGLSAAPFQLNPDAGFYFGSPPHARALAHLEYGLARHEGFVVVTGEIGAGKTTLTQRLLARLDPARTRAARLVSTQLDADDALRLAAAGLGIHAGPGKAGLLIALEQGLAALDARGVAALVLVDEAQNLAPAALEELRMLTNFQAGPRGLAQVFLVGQPELRDRLAEPGMAQLAQRVVASCHLGPMDAAATQGYVEHRFRTAGGDPAPVFAADAWPALHAATGGLPRRINTLCDRLLLAGFLDDVRRIDAARVRAVAAETPGMQPVPAPAVPPVMYQSARPHRAAGAIAPQGTRAAPRWRAAQR